MSDLFDRDLIQAEEELHQRLAKASTMRPVVHPTLADRERRGRVARAEVPRSELGAWLPAADRPDPVALLMGQEESRVQDLVPLRHARMAVSPFAFYRGSALVMASDLASQPRTALDVQLCGDAHLSNFGVFGAPDRTLVFDVNDFDETHPGPFEWDVKRLVTSFLLATRDSGLSDRVGQEAATAASASYRTSMAEFAQMPEIDLWYERLDLAGVYATITGSEVVPTSKELARRARRIIDTAAEKARSRDSWSAVSKLTEVVDGQRRFRSQPPVLARLDLDDDVAALFRQLFREYRATLQEDRQELLKRYEIIDFGHKVVGVGSVGLLAFVFLLRGRDDEDLMVLQVKQAQSSVLEAFTRPSVYTRHGRRVVVGQRLMQAASDSFLGWIDGPRGRSFYVRQLRDMKWSPDPSRFDELRIQRFAVVTGRTLARAHARAGDAVALAAYLGKGRAFDKAMVAFGKAYVRQVDEDYAAFMAAIRDGRITAYEEPAGAQVVTAVGTLSNAGLAEPAPPATPAK
ncbi:DUF2252 domain-containing protein, partial [Nocardioides sp.]|uniref:DUF2252 domain-containing protein n=1 Tax=Nocardioides sp. TaxID=35761 RepID=UPI00352749DD